MTVLFASAHEIERAENIKALWDEYPGIKQFTRIDPWRTSKEIREGEYDLLVIDEYPSYSKSPVIMVDHGVAGCKLCGLDQPYPYIKAKDTEYLTWVIAASTQSIGLIAKRCGVKPHQVLPLGVPSTDDYFKVKKGGGGSGLKADRIYLYVPTYRTREEMPAPVINYKAIDDALTDGELFVVKNHMMTGLTDIGQYKHIIQIDPKEPSKPYVIDCDVLITDFSSIMFDGHIAGKPVVLFEKDVEAYKRARGLYRPYPQGYASRHTSNEPELVNILRDAKKPQEADIKVINEVADMCDGQATGRIVTLIKEVMGENVPRTYF